MGQRATITGEIRSWDETTYREIEGGGKLTKATVGQAFTGDLQGEGTVEFLMCYRPDGTATFVGQQHVTGILAGRSGAFAVQTSGVYEGGDARASWSVIEGSGTGALAGLRGQGTSVAPSGSRSELTLDYELD